jgi:mono/diheme cytochrome c family protein
MKQENSRRTVRLGFGRALLLIAVLTTTALAAPAEEEIEGHPGFLAANGRVTFRATCANCHGNDAKGGGNIAQYLTVRPTDLTLLKRKHDGEFPRHLVQKVIDGTEAVRGHGRREMPIWGDVFRSPLAGTAVSGQESGDEQARRKIRELVIFLESIQREDETSAPRE